MHEETTHELTRAVLATVAQKLQQEKNSRKGHFSFHVMSPSFWTIVLRLRIMRECSGRANSDDTHEKCMQVFYNLLDEATTIGLF